MVKTYRIKPTTYQELVKHGWESGVPSNIGGKHVEITADYTDMPDPHVEVKVIDDNTISPFGVPKDCLEQL